MARYKQGCHSIRFPDPPRISCWASAAGKAEAQGPLGHGFDLTSRDPYWGEKTWEQAEQKLQQQTLETLLGKAGLGPDQLDAVFSGDLMNQCIASSFALRNSGIPHLGLYGACSTMAEGLILAAAAVSGGYADRAAVMASSHFSTCERQSRFPLGYGGQRPHTSQWTVTGAGAVLLTPEGSGPRISACTVGTVTDLGIRDAGNLGAAMAPAAFETLRAHFQDMKTGPEDYDLIVTGDLGRLGKELLLELGKREGLYLGGRLEDCGCLIFPDSAGNCGGSGAGCSALALCADLLGRLKAGKLHRLLFCGTGALFSPISSQQKLPIPGICHAVVIEGRQ